MSNVSDGTLYELLQEQAGNRNSWKLMDKMEAIGLLQTVEYLPGPIPICIPSPPPSLDVSSRQDIFLLDF